MPDNPNSTCPIEYKILMRNYVCFPFNKWIKKRINEGRFRHWKDMDEDDEIRFSLCKSILIDLYLNAINDTVPRFKSKNEFEKIMQTSPKYRQFRKEVENRIAKDLCNGIHREIIDHKLKDLNINPDEALKPIVQRSCIQSMMAEFKDKQVMRINPPARPSSYLVAIILIGLGKMLEKSEEIPGDVTRKYEEMAAFFQYFTEFYPLQVRNMLPLTFDAVRSRFEKLGRSDRRVHEERRRIIHKLYDKDLERLKKIRKENKKFISELDQYCA